MIHWLCQVCDMTHQLVFVDIPNVSIGQHDTRMLSDEIHNTLAVFRYDV